MKNYNVSDGLPQSSINTIFEDSRGYIWFGTHGGGLSRFDGKTFKNFGEKNGLNESSIFSIFEDDNKKIFFGTYYGVYKYIGNEFKFLNPSLGYPEGEVWTILKAPDGKIYFTDTKKGIIVLKNGKIVNIPAFSSLKDQYVVTLAFDKNKRLWIGTKNGLKLYQNNHLEDISIPQAGKTLQIITLYSDSKNRLWVGGHNELFMKKGTEWIKFDKSYGLKSTSVWAIKEIPEGKILLGTKEGLSEYNGNTFTTYSVEEGLVNRFVTSIHEDRNGTLWLGTDDGVSKMIEGLEFEKYSTHSGLRDNNIWSFFDDSKGNIYISTDKGSDIYSYGIDKIEADTSSFSDKTFYPMFKDKRGNRWICINNTVFKTRDRKILKTFTFPKESFSFFYTAFEDSRSRIWFGTDLSGILLFENGKFNIIKGKKIFNHNSVTSIIEDDQKRIWIGTEQGLIMYDGENFKKIPIKKAGDKFYVTEILKDERGYFWIGAFNKGLIYFDPSQFTPDFKIFNIRELIPQSNIISMTFDNNGDLWVGTNRGFFRVNLKNFQSDLSGRVDYFSENMGVGWADCNEKATICDTRGRIWLGTSRGVITFDPEKIAIPKIRAGIFITDVLLFLGSSDISKFSKGLIQGTKLPLDLSLPYNNNQLTFKFNGIAGSETPDLFFKWKLDPVDKEWSAKSKQTQVTYSNLGAGNYTFSVKCYLPRSPGIEKTAQYEFKIVAPFWKSGKFIILSILLAIFAITLFYYLKTKSMKTNERRLKKIVEEKTDLLNSEKKKIELINQELERRVVERTNELEKKNDELLQAQKLEAIGALAGGVAHDLNNILSGVVSYPDLLLRKIPADDPNRRIVEKIKKSGEKAADMVQDLLTLTRKGVLNMELLSVNDIVDDFVSSSLFEKLNKIHPNISYKTDLTSEDTYIMGSDIHITKAIMNLVINASEAMPLDGDIIIRTERKYLDMPLKGYNDIIAGHYIILSIKDTGIGIDKKDLNNIFEPFFSKKNMGKSGTGLGMTVVLWTARDHSGYIVINSIKGKGTEFQLFFPASNKKPEIETKKEDLDFNTAYIGRGEHILIVEDDDDNRILAEEILSECNYDVHSVTNGEDAIKYIERDPVDLLVLDMLMDGLNGLETYMQILMRKSNQKAIITSGYSENELVKEAMRLGAGAYLKKPYLKMQLIQAVESELTKI